MMRVGMVIAAFAMLTACGDQAPPSSQQMGDATQEAALGEDGKADCATGGSGRWGRDCPIERAGKTLTIRHPDGGFRRFRVLDDGHGLETADGAEAAKLTILDDRRIEIIAGQDRYRLPAQIGVPVP